MPNAERNFCRFDQKQRVDWRCTKLCTTDLQVILVPESGLFPDSDWTVNNFVPYARRSKPNALHAKSIPSKGTRDDMCIQHHSV